MGSASGDESALSKKETYKQQLAKLQCPFTWKMEDIPKSISTDYNPHDEEESIPLMKMLRVVMTLYMDTRNGVADVDSILDNLKICDGDYRALKNSAHPEISTKVAYAVLQATKCFVYLKLDMKKELDLLLKNLENIDDMNDKEKSTLLGCKSICWSKYHRIGSHEAEEFIREAIELNGNCDVWYYILGKNIRRQRRDDSITGHPNREETESFLKAYELSKNPVYGIFVAQMYRESNEFHKALQVYENVFKSFDTLSDTVLLRLALGFISQRKFDKAKLCLDEAAINCGQHSMYLHYRGIYHMRINQFAEAALCLKKAIDDKNLPAERQYLECLLKLQKSLNVTRHLLNVVDKYKELSEKQLQSLILDVGFSYWTRDRDMDHALEYFLRAIKIDPQSKSLTNYTNFIFQIKNRNTYLYLEDIILPIISAQSSRFKEATIAKADAIKEFCKLYHATERGTKDNASTRIKVNLDTAFRYWVKENDVKQSINFFLRAIEVNPQSRFLKNYQNDDDFPVKEKNVYVFLEKFILPIIDSQSSKFDAATIKKANAIKEFCQMAHKAQMDNIENVLTRVNINKY